MSESPETKAGSATALPTVARRPALIALFLFIACLLLAGDLVLKSWAFESFAGPVDIPDVLAEKAPLPTKEMTVIANVLAIKLVLNRGAVFGLGQGYTWVFLLITVVAVGFVGYVLLSSPSNHRVLHVCLALILAGALGNMIDRIVFSAVRDMLYLLPGVQLPFGWKWGNGSTEVYPWIFNLADVYLTVGIAAMLLRSMFPLGRTKPSDG